MGLLTLPIMLIIGWVPLLGSIKGYYSLKRLKPVLPYCLDTVLT